MSGNISEALLSCLISLPSDTYLSPARGRSARLGITQSVQRNHNHFSTHPPSSVVNKVPNIQSGQTILTVSHRSLRPGSPLTWLSALCSLSTGDISYPFATYPFPQRRTDTSYNKQQNTNYSHQSSFCTWSPNILLPTTKATAPWLLPGTSWEHRR